MLAGVQMACRLHLPGVNIVRYLAEFLERGTSDFQAPKRLTFVSPVRDNEIRNIDFLLRGSLLVAYLFVDIMAFLVVPQRSSSLAQVLIGHAKVHQLQLFELPVSELPAA